MGLVVNSSSSDVEKDHTGASQAGATASPQIPEGRTVTYQLILRHLAKFRDGAMAALRTFSPLTLQPPMRTGRRLPIRELPLRQSPNRPKEPKSSLEIRIEHHMSKVDQALRQIRDLIRNARRSWIWHRKCATRSSTQERTIHDIVGEELHFWSAAIENNELDKFDQTEQTWVRRIIRLANIIGVDAEHKEHLEFLEDWASQEHSFRRVSRGVTGASFWHLLRRLQAAGQAMPDAIALARSVCPARSLERRDSNDWILVPRRRVS